ncbi:TlpA family protein disulfide reductase [Sediminibacterium ginsengisoli]|uniref:Thiol-disulfide isomerase or thioredoxin n=1 Tax=Sediminibacterium ginsengisoli TaxID=413434 RepID=A0A1T4Q2F6_9BACT|nr:TlpA disulfide reductase family protein [Sediminibacterium ginsengisoli]SJZ98005.1 Thiol-disulfide isomerase or thioredoxin [Sediminibacterium ginsengisoli]
MKRIAALLLVLLLLQFRPEAQEMQLTTITNHADENFYFYYHDSVAMGRPVVLHKGQTRLALTSPVLLLHANQDQIPYYVYPGEKLYVEKDKENRAVFSVKDDPVRSNELLLFKDMVAQTGKIYDGGRPEFYQKKVRTADSVQLFIQTIKRKEKSRLDFIESFRMQHSISQSFYKIAIQVVQCTAVKDLLLLYRNNIELLKRDKLFESYVNECIASLEKIGYAPNIFYLHAAMQSLSIHFDQVVPLDITDTNDFARKYAFAQTRFSGTMRDFLLATCLFRVLSPKFNNVQKSVADFNQHVKDNGYRNIIRDKAVSILKPVRPAGTGEMAITNGSSTTLSAFFEANKGKLILLDFWASWCAPCRSEMPASKKIQAQFSNKQIVFAYISIDQNKKDWLRAAAEEELHSYPASFLLENADTNSFVKANKITTIPRYILIGKDGKIIAGDAPRPSEPDLVTLIKKHL